MSSDIREPALDPEVTLARARAGDPELLRDLFTAYRGDLLAFLERRCGHTADAEDALQDTFAAAARYLDGFRGDAAMRTWLYRLAGSACTKMRRGARNDPHRHTHLDEMSTQGAAGEATPEARRARVEATLEARLLPLEAALGALSDQDRGVLLLRDGHGMSTEETAAELGLTPAAVKSRLHRARKAIRTSLT